jgi:hypothetical protein
MAAKSRARRGARGKTSGVVEVRPGGPVAIPMISGWMFGGVEAEVVAAIGAAELVETDPALSGLAALAVAVARMADASVAAADAAAFSAMAYRLTVLLRELRLTPGTRGREDGDERGDALMAALQRAAP